MNEYTYPRIPIDGMPPATPPTDRYTCPLACSETMGAVELAAHVASAAEHAVQSMRRQYTANHLTDHIQAASVSVRARYAALLESAIPGPLPDWRNSDGLRGYADRMVRIIAREEVETSDHSEPA